MIVQPYVENSVWHGIMHNDKKGRLEISFKKQGDFLLCSIIDNGIGLKASQRLNRSRTGFRSKSFGTSITKDRLEKMSTLYKLDVSVELSENFDEQGHSLGTIAKLKVPIIKKK